MIGNGIAVATLWPTKSLSSFASLAVSAKAPLGSVAALFGEIDCVAVASLSAALTSAICAGCGACARHQTPVPNAANKTAQAVPVAAVQPEFQPLKSNHCARAFCQRVQNGSATCTGTTGVATGAGASASLKRAKATTCRRQAAQPARCFSN